jgi:copper chaperone CopZ
MVLKDERRDLRSAHLVWSPGFVQSLVSSVATLGFAAYVCSTSALIRSFLVDAEETLRLLLLKEAHRWALWGVLSLLSSSCCLIQLLLSTFSVGCAGLNTWIGPWRPSLLALTLCLQAATWHTAFSSPVFLWKQCFASTVLSLGHSFLPEFLYLFAAVRGGAYRSAKADRNEEGVNHEPETTATATTTLVTLQLSNLGCSACMTAVTGVALSHKPFVRRILEVSITEGLAYIEVSGRHDDGGGQHLELLEKLTADLDAAGFPAKVIVDVGSAPHHTSEDELTAKAIEAVAGKATDEAAASAAVTPLWCDLTSAVSCLLASSCCVLQLGLNVLSTLDIAHVGCLGFNKTLGPLRQLTRALTLAWLAVLWTWTVRRELENRRSRRHHFSGKGGDGSSSSSSSSSSSTSSSNNSRPQSDFYAWIRLLAPLALRTALTVGLTWLPELLLIFGGPALAPPFTNDVEFEALRFKVEGMGCEACLAHVNSILATAGGVVSGSVADLDEGVAELLVAKEWAFDATDLARRLSTAGFELLAHPTE